MLVVLLIWPLAAFGGRDAVTAIPFGLACLVYAFAMRAWPSGNLDRALLALCVCVGIQLMPLPAAVLDLLSPHAREVREALTLARPATPPHVLSIDVRSTAWAAAVLLGAVALFWAARARFAAGGLRQTIRGVAAVGLALSGLAIAQAATAGRKIYWLVSTEFEGPPPFGPFVNRNHFATWAIMAVPLTFGYIAAHASVHWQRTNGRRAHGRARFRRLLDPRTTWLALAVGMMLVALLLSLSRSGAMALGGSALVTLLFSGRTLEPTVRRRGLAAVVVLTVFAVGWSDLPKIAERLAAVETGLADRLAIWRETLPIVRNFWLAGTGGGTYQLAMFVYQQAERTVYFNQAHNHYLQVAAEGGLLVVVPFAIAAAVFVAHARRQLAHQDSSAALVRLGAACGLGAVALQSVWETGLVMPANAALAAVLAAALVHSRHESQD